MRYTKYVYSKLSSLTTLTFYAQALGLQQICNFFIAMANCASVSAAKSLLSKTYKPFLQRTVKRRLSKLLYRKLILFIKKGILFARAHLHSVCNYFARRGIVQTNAC